MHGAYGELLQSFMRYTDFAKTHHTFCIQIHGKNAANHTAYLKKNRSRFFNQSRGLNWHNKKVLHTENSERTLLALMPVPSKLLLALMGCNFLLFSFSSAGHNGTPY